MELDGWQATLPNCRDKLAYILNTTQLSDVIFIIGEEREIVKAHSLILRLNSPVFDVMLSGRWGSLPMPLTPTSEISSTTAPIASSSSSSSITSFQDESTLEECTRCRSQSYIPRRFRHHPYLNINGDKDRGDEQLNGVPNTIALPHLDPVSFRLFLKYIYTDEFDVPVDFALQVWHLAEFYNVPSLTEKCELLVIDSLDKDNALMLYQHAQTVHNVRIAEMAFQYVLFHARVIFASDAIKSLSIENLIMLLKEDRLDIEEASLFVGVHAWAEAECARQEISLTPENIRAVLGEAFGLIRFPLIPAHRFTMDVVPKKLLSDDELIKLYKYITLPSIERQSRVIDLNFSRIPRRPVYHLSRYNFQQCRSNGLTDYSENGRLYFTVDHELSFVGVGIFASTPSGKGSYEIIIEVKSDDDSTVLTTVEKTIEPVEPKYSIVPILFQAPIQLEKGGYNICFNIKGPITYFNSASTCRVVAVKSGNVGVTFEFSSNQMSHLEETFEVRSREIPIPELYFLF